MASDPHATTVICVITLLRENRVALGLSQEKLAKLAGLSRTGIRHIESGQFKPTLYSLLKIAEALGLDLSRLIRQAQKLPASDEWQR
ncbi:MAG: helix-turn-helix transcriptional regulator [Chthoniobacteraceae bacterium]